MTEGNIIVLNGPSSSGKTTLLRSLQDILDQPYLDAGIDKFIWMLPRRYRDVPEWHEVFEYQWADIPGTPDKKLQIKAGPLGHELMGGMHRAIAELSRAGLHVLVDHVLIEPRWVRECALLFADLPAWFVGIRCPLDVLEQREKTRRDRTLGQARAQYGSVHAHGVYDLEVDTSACDATTCALQIKQFVQVGAAPRAFQLLRQRIVADVSTS